jgi:hypothetical protein
MYTLPVLFERLVASLYEISEEEKVSEQKRDDSRHERMFS